MPPEIDQAIGKAGSARKAAFAFGLYSSKFVRPTLLPVQNARKPTEQLQNMIQRQFISKPLRDVFKYNCDIMCLLYSKLVQIREQLKDEKSPLNEWGLQSNLFVTGFGLYSNRKDIDALAAINKLQAFFASCFTFFRGGSIPEMEDFGAFGKLQEHYRRSHLACQGSGKEYLNFMIHSDKASLYSLPCE